MPTLYKPQLTERESPWGATYDQMHSELCRDRAPILTALGFYAEHDLVPPEENSASVATKDEEDELRQIPTPPPPPPAAPTRSPGAAMLPRRKKVSSTPACHLTDK